jgi:hypothetical protein
MFDNIQTGRIIRAIAIVSLIGTVLSFSLCYCYLIIKLMDNIDPEADLGAQQTAVQNDAELLLEDIYRDIPSDLNILYMIQLFLAALLVYWQAYWAARHAQSSRLAMIQATSVGIGVVCTYGLLLLLFSPVPYLLQLIFDVIFITASALAGRTAGQLIEISGPIPPRTPARQPGRSGPMPFGRLNPPPTRQSVFPVQVPTGENPDIYYNMGVSAALGGRREEARQHFTHTLQIQPRHVAAWLQLANLANTPEQAWNYIQQARAIDPHTSDVMQAVNVVWPQVAANAGRPQQPPAPAALPPDYPVAPPHIQPPYKGGQLDDIEIPRVTLPDITPPEPESDADIDTDVDADTDTAADSDDAPPPADPLA